MITNQVMSLKRKYLKSNKYLKDSFVDNNLYNKENHISLTKKASFNEKINSTSIVTNYIFSSMNTDDTYNNSITESSYKSNNIVKEDYILIDINNKKTNFKNSSNFFMGEKESNINIKYLVFYRINLINLIY